MAIIGNVPWYTRNYSHLVGIMISKTIGYNGVPYFQTNPHSFFSACSFRCLGSWPIDAPTVLIRVFGSQGLGQNLRDTMKWWRRLTISQNTSKYIKIHLKIPEIAVQQKTLKWQLHWAEKMQFQNISTIFKSVLYMALSENGVYSQWNSHLIGIIIINHWVQWGTNHFQTHPNMFCAHSFCRSLQKITGAGLPLHAILGPFWAPERSILTWQELCQALQRCWKQRKRIGN